MKVGWKEVKLREICDIISGKHQKNVIDENGQYPIYGSGGIIGRANEYLCEAGTTIIGRKGTINSPIYVNTKFWNIDTAFGLSPKDGLNNKLLYYFCLGFNFKQLDKSTAVPSLAKRDLLKISFPLPPLPEQQKIVTKIETLFSELDNGIANLQAAKAKLTVYRQSVLKKAFEGELTKAWRERQEDLPNAETLLEEIKAERVRHYEAEINTWKADVKDWEKNGKIGRKPKKPRKAKPLTQISEEEFSKLYPLPKTALYLKIGELCDVVRGGSPRPAGDERYYNGKIPFLKVADLTRQKGMYVTSFTFTIKEAGLHKTRLLKKGTLVLSNSGATLGVPKITGIEATANDGIAAFLGLKDYMKPYLYHFWNSQTEILRNINQGAAQPNLNTDLIRNFIVPIFSEAEQTQIVQAIESRLNAADEMLASIEASLEKAEALRQSVLKRAFEGKLV